MTTQIILGLATIYGIILGFGMPYKYVREGTRFDFTDTLRKFLDHASSGFVGVIILAYLVNKFYTGVDFNITDVLLFPLGIEGIAGNLSYLLYKIGEKMGIVASPIIKCNCEK